jgi:hypothetical protein
MRQVCVAKMNESELLKTCRNESGDVNSRLGKRRMKSPAEIWVLAGRHPAHRQHERNTGSGMERGNLSSRCKGSGVKQRHCERLSTDARHRDRWLRSSVEVPVMGMEQREPVVDGPACGSTKQLGGTREPV